MPGLVPCSPQWGIAVAALLCHRYFSRRSMKRNDRFVSGRWQVPMMQCVLPAQLEDLNHLCIDTCFPVMSWLTMQLIATACLHLAAKLEESPKPIKEVVSGLL